ncbi:MAG: peptidoglycan DL-endopeptidase CwlS [Clostridia bacterium]|nr:peptidoglycan DL-endopeptidase CwlS [Clostridia bacterium]
MRICRVVGIIFTFLLASIVFLPKVVGAEANPGIILYRVQHNDTLWFLSKRYGTTINDIYEINNLTENVLYPGQILYLPVSLTEEYYKYTVQPGDTLYLIGKRNNCSITSIREASNLMGDNLYPGQSLLLPLARTGNDFYKVKPGDSLFFIAQKFNISVKDLIVLNDLPSDLILVNQILQVPSSLPKEDKPPISESSPPLPDKDTLTISELPVYRVMPGDTLSGIAEKFNTTINAIYVTNRLNSYILMPGQPLYIPENQTEAVNVEGPKGDKKPGYGEFLNWQWARWVYNVGAEATITDLDTGLTFKVRHLGGSNHADSEPLTSEDTAVMKKIFNSKWSWDTRAILLKTGDRVLAASMAGQPHGIQTISDNNFPGHFDVYFWNSRSHNTNEIKSYHQANVLRAAGMD